MQLRRYLTGLMGLVLLATAALSERADSKPGNTNADQPEDQTLTSPNLKQADIGLLLTRSEDGAIHTNKTREISTTLDDECYILKIGDAYTKGRPTNELQMMLAGPAGSSIALTILNRSNELSVETFKREKIPARQSDPYNAIFAGINTAGQTAADHARIAHESGADLTASALYTDILNYQPLVRPKISDQFVNTVLPKAMEFYETTGAFGEADAALLKLTALSERSLGHDSASEVNAILEAARYLGDTHRQELADQMYRHLYSTIQESTLENRKVVLRSYGELLAGRGDFRSALPIFQQLEACCATDSSAHDLDYRQAVAAFYERSSNIRDAERVLQHVAEIQRQIEKTEDRANKFEIYRPRVLTLTTLSKQFAAESSYGPACDVLNKARDLYLSNLDAEEVVRLERSISPSVGDLEGVFVKSCVLTLLGGLFLLFDAIDEFDSFDQFTESFWSIQTTPAFLCTHR